MKDNISSYKNPNDLVGKLRSVATFTNLIGHTRYLRATCKALDRLAKKLKRMQSQQPTYREYVAHFSYLAIKLHVQADQYKIGDRPIEAIQLAELKQAEREVIQECYAAHRNLDKFFGNTRSTNTTNLSVQKHMLLMIS